MGIYKDLNSETDVKYRFYSKIFKWHFDQVDTCCMCETLDLKLKSNSLNAVAKNVSLTELLIHQWGKANKLKKK